MTFILIPGAGGDSFYWHRVVPLLPGAEAIDLPAGRDGAGLAEYADVISAAVDGRDDVVLVAQSMQMGNPMMSCVGKPQLCGLVPRVARLPPKGTTSASAAVQLVYAMYTRFAASMTYPPPQR